MGLFKSLFGPKTAKMVEVAPFGARFEVPSGETLLEAALRNGVAFPHNCTVGTCGSCKCRLKSGRVKALTDFGYTLSQQEISAGFILACQALPQDANTQVEVEAGASDARAAENYVGKLLERQALTHDIVKITLELDRPMPYLAGQYASLQHAGLQRGRSYSFADAPEREGQLRVSFFIRKVPQGAFTEDLFNGALDEQTITVNGPHGHFYLRPGLSPMICIAGGSGLAPLMSLLERARKDRVKRRCVLLFGARTQADLYCLEQIRQLAQGWNEEFVFLPVLSHEAADSDWTGARGLVTDFIPSALSNLVWSQAEGYLCGPPGMIDAAIDRMGKLGMPVTAIHYDKFTDESHAAKKG